MKDLMLRMAESYLLGLMIGLVKTSLVELLGDK